MEKTLLHTYAWMAWLAAALTALSATRNPLYLLIAWLCLAIVAEWMHNRAVESILPFSPWRLAAFIIASAALFNALTSHVGATQVWVIPGNLPLISGPLTLEALAFGATNGLVLGGILIAFTTLNLAVPARELMRLIPRVYFPVALVVSIAIGFMPSMFRQLEQVREAQMVRGHRLRGLGDWLPLFIPLLVGSLERSFQLAEAMTARGFAASAPPGQTGLTRLALLGGALLLIAGLLLLLLPGWSEIGAGLALSAAALILAAMWQLNRRLPHTRYTQQPLKAGDWLVGGAALGLIGLLASWKAITGDGSLTYTPYPALQAPAFQPLLGMALLLLLAPLFLELLQPGEER